MTRSENSATLLVLLLGILLTPVNLFGASYKYVRLGQKEDKQSPTQAGIAMLGGGEDLDDAFRWMCAKTGGGDFLILRARGSDDYNPYVNQLCHVNSVATLIIPNRKAAQDPAVADIIRHAEAVFIAGGDQSRYIKFWRCLLYTSPSPRDS